MASAEFEVIAENRNTRRPRRVPFLLTTKGMMDGVREDGGHDDDGGDRGQLEHFLQGLVGRRGGMDKRDGRGTEEGRKRDGSQSPNKPFIPIW